VLGPRELLPGVTTQRTFRFESLHGAWVINGEFFDENRINARPTVNRPEIWSIEGVSGGWAHPVHIHLAEFFILSRNGATPPVLERGRKDTVVVGPNTSVKILMPFPHYTGRYVFHCHNLDHEDMRMMGQFEIQP